MSETIETVWAELEAFWRAQAPEEIARIASAASDADVEALEREIGARLPDEYRVLLRLRSANAKIDGYEILPVKSVLSVRSSMNDLVARGTFENAEVVYGEGGEFRLTWWHPGWLPIAQDSGGNLIAMDLDPAEKGKRGQLIAWETVEGPALERQRDLLRWLVHYRDDLRAGKLEVEESGFLLRRRN